MTLYHLFALHAARGTQRPCGWVQKRICRYKTSFELITLFLPCLVLASFLIFSITCSPPSLVDCFLINQSSFGCCVGCRRRTKIFFFISAPFYEHWSRGGICRSGQAVLLFWYLVENRRFHFEIAWPKLTGMVENNRPSDKHVFTAFSRGEKIIPSLIDVPSVPDRSFVLKL